MDAVISADENVHCSGPATQHCNGVVERKMVTILEETQSDKPKMDGFRSYPGTERKKMLGFFQTRKRFLTCRNLVSYCLMVDLSECAKSDGKRGYKELTRRLTYLEKWREIAVRPASAFPEDDDLMQQPVDDFDKLNQRCRMVRALANACLPKQEGPYDSYLEPRKSNIPDAGMGLFTTRSFTTGEIICYYYGHIHTYHSARHLFCRDYLMVVQGNVLVDPGPLPDIKARYINDPLNDALVNVRYVPETTRSAVVALRAIDKGEELYVAYGEGYWAQQRRLGRSYYPERSKYDGST